MKIRAYSSLLAALVAPSLWAQTTIPITSWTTTSVENLNDQNSGGITYERRNYTVASFTSDGQYYNVTGAGSLAADRAFVRRNNATSSGGSNVNGFGQMMFSNNSATTVYGGLYSSAETMLLSGNLLNSTFDTFANVNVSGSNNGAANNIERIDYVFSGGYTVLGNEVISIFNVDPVGERDDFRVALFTGISGTGNNIMPTTYASTGMQVSLNDYGGSLPLPYPSGTGTSESTTVIEYNNGNNLTGTPPANYTYGSNGIGGVAIKLTDLGVSVGQVIYGYSLMSPDNVFSTASDLVNFQDSTHYLTNTANGESGPTSGTADFVAFGGRISSPVPEPSTYGLIALGGLTGFAWLRRQKQRATAAV